ncbi:hypothetical protein FisN_3Lh382 [Fistulifera solaris]|uniref:Uncharacterized protein n=1 Tax=Fistulifera solaris TaxID=1519565 RepID=A0A1Z5J868_FISSO|nr:hypothetical protein FisN_3Lh382 [Fistulifera solaris]|eukprot:GAX10187.1 hypothetical protein FisN_3Lh382 [Fistulifera solaris]
MGFLEKLFHFGNSHQQGEKGGDYHNHCPIVTLFFDATNRRTIAVLSKRKESLDVYFMCRVAQGTAFEKSPFYYELHGYIRENLVKICRHEGFFPEAIAIAVGALAASDASQKEELTRLRNEQMQSKYQRQCDEALLENALEIARLHRLSSDLDVLDVYCMRQASKVLGRVAARIARNKMLSLKLHVTPFVDGVLLSGYSTFMRAPHASLIRISETGRLMEYQRCNDIPLESTETDGSFSPSTSNSSFSWKCEEIALANLHKWWGDIVVRDYVGHKLVVSWTVDPLSADASTIKSKTIAIATVRIDDCPGHGKHHYQAPHVDVALNIRSTTKEEYGVAFATEGSSVLTRVNLSFLALVRVSARSVVTQLEQSYNQQLLRPLLDHEVDYLETIKAACAL